MFLWSASLTQNTNLLISRFKLAVSMRCFELPCFNSDISDLRFLKKKIKNKIEGLWFIYSPFWNLSLWTVLFKSQSDSPALNIWKVLVFLTMKDPLLFKNSYCLLFLQTFFPPVTPLFHIEPLVILYLTFPFW